MNNIDPAAQAIRSSHLFWKVTYIKRSPILNWLLVGTIALVLAYLYGYIAGEFLHWWVYVYFCYFLLAGVPLIAIHTLDLLAGTAQTTIQIFALKPSALRQWLFREEQTIFNVRSIWLWAGGATILLLGELTVVAVRHDIKTHLVFWGMLVSGVVIFLWCGQGGSAVLKLMQLQHRLVRLPLSLTFLESGKQAVDWIKRAYNFVSLAILMEYVGLLVAVKLSPFRDEPIMSVWLFALAAYPILSYIWSLSQTHVLLRQIKYFHLASVNAQLERVYQDVAISASKENLERLEKLVAVQRFVDQASEWPISPQVIFTLLITSAAAVAQFVAAWSAVMKAKP